MNRHGHASVSHHDQNSCTNKSPTDSRPFTPVAAPHLQTILHCQTTKNEAIVTSPPPLFKLARCTTTCQAMVETPSPSDDSLSLRAWCLALDFDAYILLCHTALLPFICLLPFLSFPFLPFPGSHSSSQRLVRNNNWRMSSLRGNPAPWRRQKAHEWRRWK